MLILAVIPVIFVLILASALLAVARRWAWAALFLAGAVVLNVCTKQIPLNLSYVARDLFSYACAHSSQSERAGDRGGAGQCEVQSPSQSDCEKQSAGTCQSPSQDAHSSQSECAGDRGGAGQCETQSPCQSERAGATAAPTPTEAPASATATSATAAPASATATSATATPTETPASATATPTEAPASATAAPTPASATAAPIEAPATELGQAPTAFAPAPIPLRVFEYNVCAKGEMQAMHDDGFIDFILSQDADILFLPENLYYTDQKLDTVLSEHYPYSVYANLSSKLWPEEMGIYSRYPLRDIARLPSPFNAWGSDMMMSAVARVGDIDVQLLHLHCYSNSHGIRKGYEGRDLEAMDITALLSETAGKGMPTIVAGDLNDLNGSRLLRSIEGQGLRDLWWKGGTGMGFTFSEGLLRFRLDHILATDHFDLKRIKVINQKRYSDHRPIVADLELVPDTEPLSNQNLNR